MKVRLTLLAALTAAALAGAAVAAKPPAGPPEEAPARGPDVAGVRSSPYADRDRNRVYDELDAAVRRLAPGERVTAIVLFTRPLGRPDVAQLQERYGGFPVNAVWSVVNGFSAELTKAQIEALSRRDDVVQVEPERVYTADMGTARRWYGVDKAKADFGLDGDRNGNVKSFSATDIGICVIDTGIDAAHVDLDQGQVIGWKDYVNGRTTPYDDHGHGTHVAGIAAGQGDGNSAYRGNAHGASLVGVKVLNSAGSGTTTNIISGVDFCVSNRSVYGIRVINMSLGSSGSSDGTDSLSTAVNNAYDAGVLPAVAAGNSGPAAFTIGSPAAAAKALTVCSLADPGEKGFFVSSFSSRGPTADGRTKPDVCAAGHAVTAAKAGSGNGYTTLSGTSMATPFVAGVAALMLDANPALTPGDLKTKITSTTEEWRSPGADIDTGFGRLQAYEAIKSAGGYTGTGPAVPTHGRTGEQTLSGTGATHRWTFGVTTTAYPVALTLIVPGASSSKDFDLYLYSPSGTLLGSSESVTRQETIAILPSSTGTYEARVKSYTGSGNYFLDVSYGG